MFMPHTLFWMSEVCPSVHTVRRFGAAQETNAANRLVVLKVRFSSLLITPSLNYSQERQYLLATYSVQCMKSQDLAEYPRGDVLLS